MKIIRIFFYLVLLLLFGYTCSKINYPMNLNQSYKKAVLVHGGGWKKLQSNNISKDQFKTKVEEYLGIKKIINYYGMIEQTGSIFMECENGWLHSNPLCNIIARDPKTLKKSKPREIGIAQVISSIPTSYPGNSLLTDDLIYIEGVDNCSCGRKGLIWIFLEG